MEYNSPPPPPDLEPDHLEPDHLEPDLLEPDHLEPDHLEPEQKKLKSSPENKSLAGEDLRAGGPTLNNKTKYKRRKIAILFAYCGAGYQGMQKNPGAKTIEADLEKALFLAGALPEQDLGDHRRVDWARSSRTDKGVSAVGQVISGRFIVDPPGLLHRLNSNLCPQIRVFGFVRTTSSFSAKKLCDRRRYAYLLPVFALDSSSHRDRESVLASVGTDFELFRCFDCSERGRKVGKFEDCSSISSFFVDSVPVSSKNGGFLLDSSVSSISRVSESTQMRKIENSRFSESTQMRKIENSRVSDSVNKIDERSSISSFFVDSVPVSSKNGGFLMDSSVNKIDASDSSKSRVSESAEMRKIENADSLNKIDDDVVISSKNDGFLLDSSISYGKSEERSSISSFFVDHVPVSSNNGIEESRASEMTQDDVDSSPSDAQIISSNGCDSLPDSRFSNIKISKSGKHAEFNEEISKCKVSISKEVKIRTLEESEAFPLKNCTSMDAGGEGRVELENTENRSAFRYGGREMEKFNRILQNYVGTHNFHNFTTRTRADDPSARRFIISFSADRVVEIDGIEFVKCEVVGQSFMLHQIRKMIGLAVAVMRGCAPESFVQTALRMEVKVKVPTAPEVGLHLEECMFTHYNARWKETHEEVTLREYVCEAESFKTDTVYPHIASAERREGVVALWLHSLNHRNYPDLRPHPTTP